MDWATDDYTRTYSDTIYVPSHEHGSGISLLDDAANERPPTRSRMREEYYANGRPGAHVREGYYTGGNIVSDHEKRRPIFNAAWDERPLHYNPNAGKDWAHLVPPYASRPYGGGPAPSLAFPMITTSEAQVGAKDLFAGGMGPAGPAAHETSTPCDCSHSLELGLQLIKVVLLVIIVVMLAMALSAASSAARGIKKAIKKAVHALKAAQTAQ